MSIDFQHILSKLLPVPDGEKPVRHMPAVVVNVPSPGLADIQLAGSLLTNVTTIGTVSVSDIVSVVVWEGDLLVVAAGSGGGGGNTVNVEDGGSFVATASTLNFGSNLAVTNDGGGQVTINAAGGGSLVDWDQKRRTAGNVIINTTATGGQNIDTGLDLVLAASTGDLVEAGISGFWQAGNVSSLDFYTWSGSALVNPLGRGLTTGNVAEGLSFAFMSANVATPFGGSILYTVQGGDIFSGDVTLRLRGMVRTGSREVQATANVELVVWAKNFGQ